MYKVAYEKRCSNLRLRCTERISLWLFTVRMVTVGQIQSGGEWTDNAKSGTLNACNSSFELHDFFTH